MLTSIKNLACVAIAMLATTVILVGCSANDVDSNAYSNMAYNSTKEGARLSTDDYKGTAVLDVDIEKQTAENKTFTTGVEVNGSLKCNVKNNPIQTDVMEKVFEKAGITATTAQNGNKVFSFTINVNDGNQLLGEFTSEVKKIDREYSIRLDSVKVDTANVVVSPIQIKNAGVEKARQAVRVPLKAFIASVGTVDYTGRKDSVIVDSIETTLSYEQYQLIDDIKVEREYISGTTWVVDNGTVNYGVIVTSVWSNGNETSQTFPYSAVYRFGTVSLEDRDVTAWNAYSVSKINGLSVGTPSKVKEEGYFTEYVREDLYSAEHASANNPLIQAVYSATHPKVVFVKDTLSYTFDFLTPDFKEVKETDDLLDATSAKEGYEMKVFRNSVTAAYGNAETGVDTQVLEERANLYLKSETPDPKDPEVKSWTWENAKQWVDGSYTYAEVDKVVIYTDGTKKTIHRNLKYNRVSRLITYWETQEENNNEATGQAGWSVLKSEAKSTTDGWKFDLIQSQLTFGVTCNASTQTDGYIVEEINRLSVEIDGDVYTFPEMTYSAQANASQAKTSETDARVEYTHSNTPMYTFGGFAMSLPTANGKIFVNKVVTPSSHDGFFGKDHGTLLSVGEWVACKDPRTPTDPDRWGRACALNFKNGSRAMFIGTDGAVFFGEFENGKSGFAGASTNTSGRMVCCTEVKDASTGIKWIVNGASVNTLSYANAKLIGFNNGHSTYKTEQLQSTITQKDGGKYQVLTIAGVNGSWDTSY
jgi:hypothetical protein